MGVHFFTGFPGFISSQLIRELFQENKTQKVIAIVLAGQYPKAMIEKKQD
ncbi:3-beta hydroxysteroid dehydrogenase OS=Lysinibacillus sphaericus OX=1421 GN=LS41612_19040 PE=4 SV=1 [Lysinibacillus sphaericus]